MVCKKKIVSRQTSEARSNQYYLVPMIFAVPIKSREHDRKDGGGVVADEAHDVPGRKICDPVFNSRIFINLLIIPVVKSPLCHLNNSLHMFNCSSECPPGSVDC